MILIRFTVTDGSFVTFLLRARSRRPRAERWAPSRVRRIRSTSAGSVARTTRAMQLSDSVVCGLVVSPHVRAMCEGRSMRVWNHPRRRSQAMHSHSFAGNRLPWRLIAHIATKRMVALPSRAKRCAARTASRKASAARIVLASLREDTLGCDLPSGDDCVCVGSQTIVGRPFNHVSGGDARGRGPRGRGSGGRQDLRRAHR